MFPLPIGGPLLGIVLLILLARLFQLEKKYEGISFFKLTSYIGLLFFLLMGVFSFYTVYEDNEWFKKQNNRQEEMINYSREKGIESKKLIQELSKKIEESKEHDKELTECKFKYSQQERRFEEAGRNLQKQGEMISRLASQCQEFCRGWYPEIVQKTNGL